MFVRENLNGVASATYLVGPRGPEYRRDHATGNIRWYCYDGLGSVLGEVDPSGTLTATRSYDVYGSVRTSAGTSTSKHKFVGSLGHPSDSETGLIYMRARYMDPVVGRFVSEDPARDGQNWLTYAGSNPVNYVDSTGRAYEWVLLVLGMIKDGNAFFYGIVATLTAVMTAALFSSAVRDGIGGNMTFLALAVGAGILAACCFAIGLGATNLAATLAAVTVLARTIGAMLLAAQGTRMIAGARAVAMAAVVAYTGYGLMLIGALVLDECD
jgi:RHS repeat-associated protein